MPAPPTADPLLALRLRLPLVPEWVHRGITGPLRHLFWWPLVVAALVGLVALDVWLVTELGSGVVLAAQLVIFQPQLLLPVTGLTMAMVAFHELGHASAARYGGARPGAMGVGIYLIWPVFYTDVTDAYRLDRRGRLRVDLGGLYFNTLFTLGIAGLYLLTDHIVFLVFLVVAQLETLRQLLPFVRLDGYYVACDLAGVPNLFAYAGPALARLLRRPLPPVAARRLDALTPRARRVLTGWALVTIPVLAANVVMLLVVGPRLAGAAYGSAGRQVRVLGDALGRAALLEALTSVVGLLFLVLPCAGVAYLLAKVAGRGRTAVVRSWGRRPLATALVVGALGAAAVHQAAFVWPEAFAAAARPPQPAHVTTVRPSWDDVPAPIPASPAPAAWPLATTVPPPPAPTTAPPAPTTATTAPTTTSPAPPATDAADAPDAAVVPSPPTTAPAPPPAPPAPPTSAPPAPTTTAPPTSPTTAPTTTAPPTTAPTTTTTAPTTTTTASTTTTTTPEASTATSAP